MKLVYGTTNKSKIIFMKKRVDSLGIEILSLTDVNAPRFNVSENGNSPLENAKIKAMAYYDALKMPLFSADSGLYIDGLEDARQPGLNIRGEGDLMNDEDAIAFYSALAKEMGGSMTKKKKNAICLVLSPTEIYEYMGDDIASHPFLIVANPHEKRSEGFPLDSLSVHIKSGKYFHDFENKYEKYSEIDDGFRAFFKRVLFGGT
jgi:8-oxo-dGTP diphosphatase